MNSPPASDHNDHDNTIAGAEKSSHQDHPNSRPTIPPRIQQKLCEDCEQLNITAASFVVSSPNTTSQRRPLYVRHGPRQGKIALRTGQDDLQLASFETIASRALTCRLCKLIVKTIRKCTPHEVDEAVLSSKIRWEVDGHEEANAESFVNRTRRLRLSWSDSLQSWAAFFIMTDRAIGQAPISEVASISSRNTFRAREILPDQGKQALIKGWLDICRREHKGACGVTTQQAEFDRLVDETYFGVIDVTDLQLKPLPRDSYRGPAKFVALSYVWGQSEKPYVTTRHNISWRRQHGGLETDLHNFPAAIRDAIKLVQKLNLRYLWVDALCIVQDSAASFRLNAAEMHTIYGNAHFTICAADGLDADTGLRAMHSVIVGTAQQDTEEIIPGLRLQIARPVEMVVKDSKWNTRGWTFQERILSRRCVIFADGRVYLQCRKAAFAEDVHNESKGSGWSVQAMGAPLRSFPEIEQRSFSFYMRCVSMFYCRDLTRPSDILAAFKGIQSVMELVMCAPFCFGLPTSHFDLALLWQPTKAVRRRVPVTRSRPTHCATAHDGSCDCKLQGDDFNGQEFPSWSWSGWVGGDVAYDTVALEGSLLTVRDWLKTHTWVRYHVLDGRGKLRPLWDADKVFEDTSTEQRWKGYPGLKAEREAQVLRGREQYDTDSDHDADVQVGVRKPQATHVLPCDPPVHVTYTGVRMPTHPETGYGYLQTQKKMLSRENRRSDEAAVILVEDRKRSRSRYRGRSYDRDYRRRPSPQMYDTGYDSPSDGARSASRSIATDDWGRAYDKLPTFEPYRTNHFSRSHPENPYRVRKTEWSWPDETQGFADLPILQFWSKLKQFRVIAVSEIRGTGLTRCHIGDTADDWCGSVTVNTDWIEEHDGEMVDFIALSDAKTFTEQEDPNWNYYTPRERSESEWEVYHALLVVTNEKKLIWERVGLGKIFKGAFSGSTWTEIMLG